MNFEPEKRQEQQEAERLSQTLSDLGLDHQPINEQGPIIVNNIEIGTVLTFRGLDKEEILRRARRELATHVARQALDTPKGILTYLQQHISPQSTANWLAELHFDYDGHRYVYIGEYIVPTEKHWKREYRVYREAKKDHVCDVPGCTEEYFLRKFTRYDRCIHLCKSHKEMDADSLDIKIHPIVPTVERETPIDIEMFVHFVTDAMSDDQIKAMLQRMYKDRGDTCLLCKHPGVGHTNDCPVTLLEAYLEAYKDE
jgi:hypothetical protein